jgi:diacylglycerol kinase (ATP)
VSARFLAVVNPAAGGGRCGELAAAALERLRQAGVEFDVAQTSGPGHATTLVREAYAKGCRRFIAVGGDGTSFEIVNGLFPRPNQSERPSLAFLPLGTGNSFLRDFAVRSAEDAIQAIVAGRSRTCDVIRLTHANGVLHYINLLTLGFAADVATVTNRRFKGLGELGYILGVGACLARLDRRAFPLRADGAAESDKRRCLFVAFSNSKFTGGNMMIAPLARPDDGFIEYVRWGPIGRLALLYNFRTLFDGAHIRHPLASRAPVRRVDFELHGPGDVMVDGESLQLECRTLEILPAALDVIV